MKRTALLTLALLLSLPALAGARLVVARGMFGVSLGSTPAQVRAKLGKPNDVVHLTGSAEWIYTPRKLVVMFSARGGRVGGLFTRNRSQRTATGLGVGSSRQAVLHAYPSADCHAGGSCVVLTSHRGHTYGTDFSFDRTGSVDAILVSQLD